MTTLADRSLADLARQIRDTLAQLRDLAADGVTKAIAVGELLFVAREALSEHSSFESWINAETGLTYPTANRYMRIAHYKDKLPTTPKDWDTIGKPGATTGINAAQTHLMGLPSIPRLNDSVGNRIVSEADKDTAQLLRAEGLSYQQIGDRLERNSGTIYFWLNPKAAKSNRDSGRKRQQLARMGLKRNTRDAAAKLRGGEVARAYTSIRKCAVDLDAAIVDSSDEDEKQFLRSALNNIYLAEDRISAALGVTK